MKRLLQWTLLAAAVASIALPLTAAEPEAPICTGEPALAFDAPDLGTARAEGAESDPALLPGTEAIGAPEPQPLVVPIGPIEPQMCGLVVCPVGTRCCNPLCSACTPPGVECTLGDCGHGPTS